MIKKRKRGLRTGFTTGACSAAAARAAVTGLVEGSIPQKIESLLPNGDRVAFAVVSALLDSQIARAAIIKDAGDDPDVTNKAHLTADVKIVKDAVGKVFITGGRGVGVVTRPGLGLEVGTSAINSIPRKNIEENVREVAGELLKQVGLAVTISVPTGELIAKKTLNGRLGIIGGISILGTTGIVHPYSTSAFREAVVQAVQVASANGQGTIVLTTGGRTEKFAMKTVAGLDPVCFVQMGDFLKSALDSAAKQKIRQLIIAGMAGKLVKMAQGEKITHAGRSRVNMELVADIARKAGADDAMAEDIRNQETARYGAERLAGIGFGNKFYEEITGRVVSRIKKDYPDVFDITVYACDFAGEKLMAKSEGGNRE